MSLVMLIEYLNEHMIKTICFVSSALTIFTKLSAFDLAKPKYLKVIDFGGEVLPLSHLKQWMKACPGARFINLYGATECTGMSSYYVVYDVEKLENGIPIGKQLPDTEIFGHSKIDLSIGKRLPNAETFLIDKEYSHIVKQSAEMKILRHKGDKQDEVGIDYSNDTYDGGLHLNLYGAEKMSRYFGKLLRENFK